MPGSAITATTWPCPALAHHFHSHRTERLEGEVALAQLAGILTRRNRAGRRNHLHPRREIGRMTDQPVLHLAVGLDRMGHHFAGMDADAGFERMQSLRDAPLSMRMQLLL